MSKLDWRRASQRSIDPARYQRADTAPYQRADPATYERTDDLVSPDHPTKPKRKKRKAPKAPTPLQLKRQAEYVARKWEKIRAKARKKIAAHAGANAYGSRAIQRQQAASKKKKQMEVIRVGRADARRAAFAEYMKTPEYADKLARERAPTKAKTKSHLQAWIEEKTGLNVDRQSLRKLWRDRLLKRSSDHE